MGCDWDAERGCVVNLVATAHDKRVTINGKSVVIAAGGWPEEVAKVEWFGAGGILTLIDGTAIQFIDDTMLVPLVVAWKTANARQNHMSWRSRLRRWLRGLRYAV